MKACMITPEYPPMQGGVGDYTSLLVQALKDLGVEVNVITSEKALTDVQGDQSAAFVSNWGFASWRSILECVGRHQPDIVHIQYQTAGYAMQTAINLLPLRLRSVRRRPKVVTTFHDLKVPYLFPKAGRLRRIPGSLLAGFSDAVIVTNCEDLAEIGKINEKSGGFLTRFKGRPLYSIPIGSNISVNPPVGYDREQWRMGLGIGLDETLLCYFGFLNSSKGIETLLEAFETLLSRGRRVKLLMAGGAFGDSDPTNVAFGRRVMERIESSNYRDLVLWTGFVGQEEISASLLASDICVLPYDEGASLRHGTLMAAISHGRAIVATEPGQSVDKVRFSINCSLPKLEDRIMLVPPKRPESLAAAIEALIFSDAKAEELRRKASELAPAFAWDIIARDTLAVYRSLVVE